MNRSIEHVLQFFKYDHLPEPMQSISEPCCHLATLMVNELVVIGGKENPEVTAGLRKLLEAKDCFVRALIAD